jgi:hypothetical protein
MFFLFALKIWTILFTKNPLRINPPSVIQRERGGLFFFLVVYGSFPTMDMELSSCVAKRCELGLPFGFGFGFGLQDGYLVM